MARQYYVYILTNRTRRLYVGVTNNLERRLYEHKNKHLPGFTSRYNLSWLVYVEEGNDISGAILREKQIKSWGRAKKIALVDSMNPQWRDLGQDWGEGP